MALKAADPLILRQLRADLAKTLREVEDQIEHVQKVELPRALASCEAILERAELKFDSAEAKRKSVDARNQRHRGADSGSDGVVPWMDESLPRSERRAALERAMRGA